MFTPPSFANKIATKKASTSEVSEQNEAVKSAENFLSLIDNGDVSKSWEVAATYFKNAVTSEIWSQQVKSVRAPLGKLKSRKLQSAKFASTLPGAPDGKYFVLEFVSSYESKQTAIETVTPMLDKDNQWRVSGYYIK